MDRIKASPADSAQRERMIEAVRDRAQAIIETEGAFRHPKDYGFFVADVAET